MGRFNLIARVVFGVALPSLTEKPNLHRGH